MAEPAKGFRIRTISYFIGSLPDGVDGWDAEIAAAAAFLQRAQGTLEAAGAPAPRVHVCTSCSRLVQPANTTIPSLDPFMSGYEVQTCRVVTRALSAATSAAAAAAMAAELERLCLAHDINFLNLGGTSDKRLLEDDVFHQIAAVTNYTSCTFRQAGMRRAVVSAGVLAAGSCPSFPVVQHGKAAKHARCVRTA